MFCAPTARVSRVGWATDPTRAVTNVQPGPEACQKCLMLIWTPEHLAAAKAWQAVHRPWLCAGFRAHGFISCVQTWCEILLEVPCFALVHFNLMVCTLNSGNKNFNAVSKLWKANSAPVNSSVVMFQCDSMSQVKRWHIRLQEYYLLSSSLVLEIFLPPSMKKESYLKTSEWAGSSDCVGKPAFSLYLTQWKDLRSHLCLFFLSVLTCLSLISPIFWVTEGNFIHKIWLFSFPGTCLISYGHMCRWELKLLHQLNHFCFSVLLYLLSESFQSVLSWGSLAFVTGALTQGTGTFVIRGFGLGWGL